MILLQVFFLRYFFLFLCNADIQELYGDNTSLEFMPPSVDYVANDWFNYDICGDVPIDIIVGCDSEALPLESNENGSGEEYVMLQDAYDPNRRWVLEQWVEAVRQRLLLERSNSEQPITQLITNRSSIMQNVLNMARTNASVDVQQSPLDLPLYEPSSLPVPSYNDILNQYRQGYISVQNINSTDTFSNKNQLAFRSSLSLEYMFQDIGEYRLIIVNNAIFTSSSIEALRDIASDIQVVHSEGNIITNLTIDTEIANSLLNNPEELSDLLSSSNNINRGVSDLRFDFSNIDSGNSLFSNLTEAREAAYEEAVMNMQNQSVTV